MATATKGRATVPADKAVVTATLSHADLMAMLGGMGEVAQQTSEFHRLSLKAGVLTTDDGEIFPPRVARGGGPLPALTVRIVEPPVYYNAFYLSSSGENGAVDAGRIGRQELNGRFTRKYDDPAKQAEDTNPANDIFDEIARLTGQRGSFRADMQVQIAPEDGQFTGDETIYTLSLPTTSIFEWRGSSRDQEAGAVSDFNFIVKLATKAASDAAANGADEAGQKLAVTQAMVSLKVGGVIADVYLLQASNDKGRDWWIISFDPIHIEPADGSLPALDAGDAGDVPF